MNLLDLFSGIGGFHLGLEQAGFKFDWVGFSEVDKYATQLYKHQFPKSKELGDVTIIRSEDLPKNIDILCGGFPCQTFSIAGKRAGFDDTRGTLFFEIARILRYFRGIGKPIPYFILENVKGLLNHDDGRTFAAIYGVLTDLDYTIECQLLNTRWWLPQNRERIYIVGHLGDRSRPKVFPIGEADGTINEGCKQKNTKSENSQTIRSRYGNGTGSHIKQLNNPKHSQQRIYDPSGISPTIAAGNLGGGKSPSKFLQEAKIRRLTPTECERLQGFPDGWTEGQSDTQRYKQLGNAVSVPVVKAVGQRCLNIAR